MLFIKSIWRFLSVSILTLLLLGNIVSQPSAKLIKDIKYNKNTIVGNVKSKKNDYKIVGINQEINPVIYNPDDLRQTSNLSKEELSDMLEGSDLQVLAEEYHEMERKYNINAVFLMALNIEESGHGRSTLAVNNNNLGGVKSKDGGWAIFEDWVHSLDYIAQLINDMYLTETGPYYNGISIYDVNVKYCIGGNWSENLNKIANELLSKIDTTIKPATHVIEKY